MVGKRSGHHVKCYPEDNIIGVEQLLWFCMKKVIGNPGECTSPENDGGRRWAEE